MTANDGLEITDNLCLEVHLSGTDTILHALNSGADVSNIPGLDTGNGVWGAGDVLDGKVHQEGQVFIKQIFCNSIEIWRHKKFK